MHDEFDDMAEFVMYPHIHDDVDVPEYGDEENFEDNDYEAMDGDHDSAMESAGWGTDEDYGYYGEDF
jgi:hypothetical protein